jgi:enoyl-CoA hydratase/carnithine racemase
MVGADTSNFYPALEKAEEGFRISQCWSKTARRLHDEFEISVGYINGKRCLGGFLELLMHCHYLISVDDARLGMPEVTLPVVPGMEGCHWPFRKAKKDDRIKLFKLLLEGKQVKAKDAVGWLLDYTGPVEDTLQTAWKIVTGKSNNLPAREINKKALTGLSSDVRLEAPDNPLMEAARKAIMETIIDSCSKNLEEALDIQAKHSADFMLSDYCRRGKIGEEFKKVMNV